MSLKANKSHGHYGCTATTERKDKGIELFFLFQLPNIFSSLIDFSQFDTSRITWNQIIPKIESHFYSPKHFGEWSSLTFSCLLRISFSSIPFKVTIGIVLFQRSNHYFTSCLSWPLVCTLTFLILRKHSFFHYTTETFLFFSVSSYIPLYLKMLSHLKTQANFNHSSMVSLCKNDNHTQILSIFTLFSIVYMITVIDDKKFYSKILKEWAGIPMCLTSKTCSHAPQIPGTSILLKWMLERK